jgi:hypothetical protein
MSSSSSLEAFIPQLAIALEPIVKLAQRLRAKLVEPLLGNRLHVDEARLFEHAQMLGDLRLVEIEALADVVHGARPGAEQFDDPEAVGFPEGGERFDHADNMPKQAYARQGILWPARWDAQAGGSTR